MAYPKQENLSLPKIAESIAQLWEKEKTFQQSVALKKDAPLYVFYEGPPSANAKPGIHHVIGRTLKDLFCRYKSQKGFQVPRKGGWDTHGLPVELEVEKALGITKADIGKKISIAEYNQACRERVMKFKGMWEDLTRIMGYWVDMDDPYITYERNYIETLWHLLKTLYQKDLLYKGYTIQPFSPAAGTQLSSHELNQPGAYRPVKDTSVVAQFKLKQEANVFFLAWTTTPWTLPSNTALTVGPKIKYVKVKTVNPYTHEDQVVILAEALLFNYFKEENKGAFDDYAQNGKNLPYEILDHMQGKDLVGLEYEQLLPYAQPQDGDAFKVIPGDFVTTEDGTGIVHTAPSFGADDQLVAKKNGIGSLTMVDAQGKFVDEMGEFAGRYVKNYREEENYVSVDIDIAVKLKKAGRAFKVEKYEHNYPHCWRTDKPIIYYPLDSWFIRTTAVREALIANNKKINWQPESIGTGRFGKWLENIVDWNLSRSRFWGTPLPIWRTEDGEEEICIGSFEELEKEVAKAVEAGLMKEELPLDFDPHRPYVDDLVLCSPKGKAMFREKDLIDVWFDSGAMPYAQWHYPFENKALFEKNFPADFIAEGMDQTRGWFYTLHAISTMVMGQEAYKNVLNNGMVLDKTGVKMSKRLGNVIDPFKAIGDYGADAIRWYIISNAQPWDNVKFDLAGVEETTRKFFGTLHNTYAFFALYANIDAFKYESQKLVPLDQRPELDQWILSRKNSMIKAVETDLDAFEPTRACRQIQNFLIEDLSNWYVRLSRRRFWKGAMSVDKQAAYQSLFECLEAVLKLMAPVAPFYSDHLFRALNYENAPSVHLSDFPKFDLNAINEKHEAQMELAQNICSLVLSIRKKEKVRVRQPLSRILLPSAGKTFEKQVEAISELVKSETNVKNIEFLSPDDTTLIKLVKPNYKLLGKKMGKHMKALAKALSELKQNEIQTMETEGHIDLVLEGENFKITMDELEIRYADIPGWEVASNGEHTVALDLSIDEELKKEGLARELVNKVQNLRKDQNFEVTDKILVHFEAAEELLAPINEFKDYICSEILASEMRQNLDLQTFTEVDIEGLPLKVQLTKQED